MSFKTQRIPCQKCPFTHLANASRWNSFLTGNSPIPCQFLQNTNIVTLNYPRYPTSHSSTLPPPPALTKLTNLRPPLYIFGFSWPSSKCLQGPILVRHCNFPICTARHTKPLNTKTGYVPSWLAFHKAWTFGRLSYPILPGWYGVGNTSYTDFCWNCSLGGSLDQISLHINFLWRALPKFIQLPCSYIPTVLTIGTCFSIVQPSPCTNCLLSSSDAFPPTRRWCYPKPSFSYCYSAHNVCVLCSASCTVSFVGHFLPLHPCCPCISGVTPL